MGNNQKTGFDVLKKQFTNVRGGLLPKSSESDRDIKNWDKRLKDQRERDWDNYAHLHIDLGTAQENQSYMIAGEYLYVEESSSADAVAKIKLNRVSNESLDLEVGVKIETVFIEIFVTNDALEDEWLDLVFGINFKYEILGQVTGEIDGGGITLANNEIQITWSAANSQSIAATANATSDVFTFSTNGSFAHIQIKADNDGTPAAGDTVDFFLLLACGDPDGAGADEYDTVNHAIPLGTLDTNSEDPALRTVNCPMVKGGKLYAVNNSAGRAITVSACILEKTVS